MNLSNAEKATLKNLLLSIRQLLTVYKTRLVNQAVIISAVKVPLGMYTGAYKPVEYKKPYILNANNYIKKGGESSVESDQLFLNASKYTQTYESIKKFYNITGIYIEGDFMRCTREIDNLSKNIEYIDKVIQEL